MDGHFWYGVISSITRLSGRHTPLPGGMGELIAREGERRTGCDRTREWLAQIHTNCINPRL